MFSFFTHVNNIRLWVMKTALKIGSLTALTLLFVSIATFFVLKIRRIDIKHGLKEDSRPFVFLTQTEESLRPQLMQNMGLDNSQKCRCDVIVLSYHKACQSEWNPPHITYLFDKNSTWRTGRNLLYTHATMKGKPRYTYYIVTDDDVFLKFNQAASEEMKQLTPLQVFQNWLLEYEPAVGVVDYAGANEAQKVRERTRKNCGIYINNNSTTNPTVYFDPLFNAFHANAAHHIFPLLNQRENVSWWYTLRHVISNVELKFRGQALIFFPISVENSLHRNYPRTLENAQEAWRDYIENVRMQAPVKYANHRLFKEYKKDPIHYVETSRTYCMKVTRHRPIIPFAHFELANDTA